MLHRSEKASLIIYRGHRRAFPAKYIEALPRDPLLLVVKKACYRLVHIAESDAGIE